MSVQGVWIVSKTIGEVLCGRKNGMVRVGGGDKIARSVISARIDRDDYGCREL